MLIVICKCSMLYLYYNNLYICILSLKCKNTRLLRQFQYMEYTRKIYLSLVARFNSVRKDFFLLSFDAILNFSLMDFAIAWVRTRK